MSNFQFNLELILFISLISQIGDLIISYFKRIYKIKDTGNIIPGHGGLLDRIDGIIFVMPITFLCVLPILINKGNTHFKHALEWNYFVGVILFYLFTRFFWRRTT